MNFFRFSLSPFFYINKQTLRKKVSSTIEIQNFVRARSLTRGFLSFVE